MGLLCSVTLFLWAFFIKLTGVERFPIWCWQKVFSKSCQDSKSKSLIYIDKFGEEHTEKGLLLQYYWNPWISIFKLLFSITFRHTTLHIFPEILYIDLGTTECLYFQTLGVESGGSVHQSNLWYLPSSCLIVEEMFLHRLIEMWQKLNANTTTNSRQGSTGWERASEGYNYNDLSTV